MHALARFRFVLRVVAWLLADIFRLVPRDAVAGVAGCAYSRSSSRASPRDLRAERRADRRNDHFRQPRCRAGNAVGREGGAVGRRATCRCSRFGLPLLAALTLAAREATSGCAGLRSATRSCCRCRRSACRRFPEERRDPASRVWHRRQASAPWQREIVAFLLPVRNADPADGRAGDRLGADAPPFPRGTSRAGRR